VGAQLGFVTQRTAECFRPDSIITLQQRPRGGDQRDATAAHESGWANRRF
jgi:hypothetical protein